MNPAPRPGIFDIVQLANSIPDAIHLEIGEPDFPTPKVIVEAAYRAAQEGYTKYGPIPGWPQLREAISHKLKTVNGFDAPVARIMVTPGGTSGIAMAMISLLQPGDEVLIPYPGWPNYENTIRHCHAVPVPYFLETEDGYEPNPDKLERHLTARTRMLVINDPSNPLGSVMSSDSVRKTVEFAHRHNLWLLSDECYDQFVFDGAHISPLTFDAERTLGIFSFSKSFAMTGWRCGYVVVPERHFGKMVDAHLALNSVTASPSQMAALAGLRGAMGEVEIMRQSYARRRDRAVGKLLDHGLLEYVPRGAFYLWCDVASCGLDSYSFARKLLEEEKVALAPGSAFGTGPDHYVRISLATQEAQLMEAIDRFVAFVSRHKTH